MHLPMYILGVRSILILAGLLACFPAIQAQIPTQGHQPRANSITNSAPTNLVDKFEDSLRKKAEAGDAEAQCQLGTAYREGLGVQKDAVESAVWYRKAAEQNYAGAQCNLGLAYQQGLGVKKDAVKAVEWFRKAADQGDADAQWNLGFCYETGQGVEKNVAESSKWYRKAIEQSQADTQSFITSREYVNELKTTTWPTKRSFDADDLSSEIKAAEKGDADAQYCLGLDYEYGANIKKNEVESVKWYTKAANQGNVNAQLALGTCYHTGVGVDKNEAMYIAWYRKAADQGNGFAQYSLGWAYEQGLGVQKDAVEAVKWYRKAADQEYATAQCSLGLCYYEGDGVPKNVMEAAKWFHKAADQGNATSQAVLGLCYYEGDGVPKDVVEAVKWFRKAAEQEPQGDPTAQYYLGFCCLGGTGVEKDQVEAVKWFRKSADQGNAHAEYQLAMLYFYGNVVEKNQVEAAKWFRKSADQGNAEAQSAMGACCHNGSGVEKNLAEAAKWWHLAADQGNVEGQVKLGLCYQRGWGVEENQIEAAKWFRKAANQGDLFAKQALGIDSQPAKTTENVTGGATERVADQGDAKESGSTTVTHISTGTGFFLAPNGYLLTDFHVVKDASNIKINTDKGSIPARLIAQDTTNDIALLKVEGDFSCLPLGDSSTVSLGETVFTVGFPEPEIEGLSPKLTKGEISSLNGMQDDSRMFQISVSVQPGNSGGALVDESGNVVGIIEASLSTISTAQSTGDLLQNVNYATKISYAKALLDTISDSKSWPLPNISLAKSYTEEVNNVQKASVLIIASFDVILSNKLEDGSGHAYLLSDSDYYRLLPEKKILDKMRDKLIYLHGLLINIRNGVETERRYMDVGDSRDEADYTDGLNKYASCQAMQQKLLNVYNTRLDRFNHELQRVGSQLPSANGK